MTTPPNVAILISKPFLEFQKVRKITQKMSCLMCYMSQKLSCKECYNRPHVLYIFIKADEKSSSMVMLKHHMSHVTN